MYTTKHRPRLRNLQGWAASTSSDLICDLHPLNDKFIYGGVWRVLRANLSRPLGEMHIAAVSYVCVHAESVLRDHPPPPNPEYTDAFGRVLEEVWSCADESILLNGVLAHARACASNGTTASDDDSTEQSGLCVVASLNTATLRMLVPNLHLHQLTVRDVLTKLEPTGVLDDDELIQYYRNAALRRGIPPIRASAVVLQSEHPYIADDATTEHVHFEHAQSILIEFDRRCEVLDDAQLTFWNDQDATKLIADWHHGWGKRRNGVRYLAVYGNQLLVKFQCAHQAKAAWGWKILVRAIIDE